MFHSDCGIETRTYRYVSRGTKEKVNEHWEESCIESVAWRQRGQHSEGKSWMGPKQNDKHTIKLEFIFTTSYNLWRCMLNFGKVHVEVIEIKIFLQG